MKTDYTTRAKKFVAILDAIIEEYGLDDITRGIYEYNYFHKRNIVFSHGLTRYAFITSDYVIKIDYDPYQIETFGGCEDEIEIYTQAKKDNMEYHFAEITRYEYNGTKYYIMPRINGVMKYEEDADYYMDEDELCYILTKGICDLHNGNYGWRKGHVCLIDYGAHCQGAGRIFFTKLLTN